MDNSLDASSINTHSIGYGSLKTPPHWRSTDANSNVEKRKILAPGPQIKKSALQATSVVFDLLTSNTPYTTRYATCKDVDRM